MYFNNSYIVIDNFLDVNIIDELNNTIIKQEPDSRFVKVNDIKPNSSIYDKALHEIWKNKLSFFCEGIKGFEFWTNVIGEDDQLKLHVDCDEHSLDKENILYCPVFTSVLYLGPKNSIDGGELAINLRDNIRSFDDVVRMSNNIDEEYIRCDDINWLKIESKYNRLVIFQGNRPHLVLDVNGGVSKETPRCAISMAAWDKEITIN